MPLTDVFPMGSAGGDGSDRSPGSSDGGHPTARGRAVEWVLVDGDRVLLALGLSAAVPALFLALHAAGLIAFTNANSVTRMASGMIAGTFSLVTLVVSINQLILSREFSTAGEFRDLLAGVGEFRADVADVTGEPAPPAVPTLLLERLVDAVRERAAALVDAVDDGDEEYRDRVGGYVDAVVESTARVDEGLEDAGDEAFDALVAAVEYDDTRQLHAAERLRNGAPGDSGEVATAFDDLLEALRLFAAAREHVKTVYLQRELTRFSQLTVYSGLPSVLAAVLIALLYGDLGGATLGAGYVPYAVSLLAAVVSVPLALLAAYILRTATLIRRTAAVGPILPGAGDGGATIGARDGDGD